MEDREKREEETGESCLPLQRNSRKAVECALNPMVREVRQEGPAAHPQPVRDPLGYLNRKTPEGD